MGPILLALFMISAHLTAQPATAFNCTTPDATCHGLVDYVVPNKTTLSVIKTRFGVKKFYDLLGANNFPTWTLPNKTVDAKQTIKIPFPCFCYNKTGVSDRVPQYVVKKNDGLDYIARTIFSALVTFQQIAAVNNISNPDLIDVGQKLWIPLPCSCDQVNGTQVVHYGHVVESGSSVEEIANRFGTTEETLLRLNGLANPGDLKADTVLDVPLRACSSSVKNDSLVGPLLVPNVPNGSYVLTAHDCVKCSCNDPINLNLHCEASQLNSSNSDWAQCPPTQCSSGLLLGNSTPIGGSPCNVTTCAYEGYNNKTISVSLLNESNCTATNSNNTRNAASKMGLEAWSWNFIFISSHLVLLSVGLFL